MAYYKPGDPTLSDGAMKIGCAIWGFLVIAFLLALELGYLKP